MLQAYIQNVPNYSNPEAKQSHVWIDIFIVTLCL
jgi:hypothetical protein